MWNHRIKASFIFRKLSETCSYKNFECFRRTDFEEPFSYTGHIFHRVLVHICLQGVNLFLQLLALFLKYFFQS